MYASILYPKIQTKISYVIDCNCATLGQFVKNHSFRFI